MQTECRQESRQFLDQLDRIKVFFRYYLDDLDVFQIKIRQSLDNNLEQIQSLFLSQISQNLNRIKMQCTEFRFNLEMIQTI